jgi:hypothetical protein
MQVTLLNGLRNASKGVSTSRIRARQVRNPHDEGRHYISPEKASVAFERTNMHKPPLALQGAPGFCSAETLAKNDAGGGFQVPKIK